MDKIDSVFNKVPEGSLKKWPAFTFIVSSIVVQITGLMFGASLYNMTSRQNFILSIIIADTIIFFLLYLSGSIGRGKRIPTAALYGNIYGSFGARLLTVAILPTGLIWIGWMTEIASKSFLSVYPGVSYKLVGFLIIALAVASSIKGIKGMELSSYIQTPVVLLLIIVGVIGILKSNKGDLFLYTKDNYILNLSKSIAFTILTWISFIPFYSDYTRFIRGKKDLAISTAVSWLGLNTFVMICGGIFAAFCGENPDIIAVFKNTGIPGVLGLVIIFLCAWTFNDRSLYSFGIAADIVVGSGKYRKYLIAAGGLCALAITYFGVGSRLVEVLNLLGNVYSPLLGIFLCDYYLLGGMKTGISEFSSMPHIIKWAFIPWIAGGICGIFIKTYQPLLSMLISILIYYAIKKSKIYKGNNLSNSSNKLET